MRAEASDISPLPLVFLAYLADYFIFILQPHVLRRGAIDMGTAR